MAKSKIKLATEPGNGKGPMAPVPWRVHAVAKETHDTFTLTLTPTLSHQGRGGQRSALEKFRFAPGQFNMLYVMGIGEAPISISSNPAGEDAIRHTVRHVGPVTKALAQLKRGDMLGLRGPFGSHWPVEQVKGNDILIIAGGIGLAPLRPVIYYLLANRADYGKIILLYGSRTPGDLLYKDELEKWRGRFDLEVEVTVDSNNDANNGDAKWRGHVGVVTTLIPRVSFDPLNTVAMICGPEIMMRFTLADLQQHGLKPENVFVSMERNMKCGVGFCGHCQYGPAFICKDGPVFRYDRIERFFSKREI